MDTPSRELVSSLIDRIDIYEDKKIDIKVSFNISHIIINKKNTKKTEAFVV